MESYNKNISNLLEKIEKQIERITTLIELSSEESLKLISAWASAVDNIPYSYRFINPSTLVQTNQLGDVILKFPHNLTAPDKKFINAFREAVWGSKRLGSSEISQ